MFRFNLKNILNYNTIYRNLCSSPLKGNQNNNFIMIPENQNNMVMNNETQTLRLRNAPSTNSNIKEVLMEKIPIYYDLLRTFRLNHNTEIINNITVNDLYSGLSGVRTMIKETAETHPEYGVTYRGLTMSGIMNLLSHHGRFPKAESIFWLLLTGDIPTELQTQSLIADWASRRRKRSNWISECQTILESLPQRLGSLEKLSIILLSLNSTDKHMKSSLKRKIMSHERWEYTFEDGMDLLAILPSLFRLLKNPSNFVASSSSTSVDEDWIDLLVEYFENSLDNSKSERASLKDFLKLVITLNADDNGGIPSLHVSQILGSQQHEFGKTIAALTMASTNEPSSGTLDQCQNFQEKIQRVLGPNLRKNMLKRLIEKFLQKSNNSLPGYEKSKIPNSAFHISHMFAKEIAWQDPQIQLSMEITKIVNSISQSHEESLVPEKNSIICPLFKFHGLDDMQLNQGLMCISRALGAVASIIWNHIINLPTENPHSCSTGYCIELMKKTDRLS